MENLQIIPINDLQAKINNLIFNKELGIGHYRFLRRLQMLVPHLIKAASGLKMKGMDVSLTEQHESGLLFYQSDCPNFSGRSRNALFHLEALCRIYSDGHDERVFENLLTQFKEIEDSLGRVDYYDGFRVHVKKIDAPKEIFDYFTERYHMELQNLTKRLVDSQWLYFDGNTVGSPALERIIGTLQNIEWKKYKCDRKNVINALIDSLEKILKKGGVTEGKKGLDFNKLEDGVHEFRRTVRWFSIYLISLGGLCRLSNEDNIDSSLEKYLQFAIFNKDKREKSTINIDANLLLILSKLIDDIGNIKDDGQFEEAMSHAMIKIGIAPEDELYEKASKLLSANKTDFNEIPKRVKSLVDDFLVNKKIPHQLMSSLKGQL